MIWQYVIFEWLSCIMLKICLAWLSVLFQRWPAAEFKTEQQDRQIDSDSNLPSGLSARPPAPSAVVTSSARDCI